MNLISQKPVAWIVIVSYSLLYNNEVDQGLTWLQLKG